MLFLLSGSTISAMSSNDFKAVLEKFCRAHYEDCFDDKEYIQNSLTVTTVEVDEDAQSYIVKGKHSYWGRWGVFKHIGVSYKAVVKPTNYGLKIRFWKAKELGGRETGWEGPCEKTIIP